MNYSVIIPTFKRNNSLSNLLNELTKQKHSDTIEIIVIDNSPDQEARKVFDVIKSKVKKQNTFVLNYCHEKQQGPSFARNRGLKVSKYEHLIFLDDDVTLSTNIFQQFDVNWAKYPNAKVIAGSVEPKIIHKSGKAVSNRLPKNLYWILGKIDLGSEVTEVCFPNIVVSAIMSVKIPSSQKKLPLFNVSLGCQSPFGLLFGEDYELCQRFHLLNNQIMYDPNIRVMNVIPDTRLTHSFIIKRHWKAGIEHYLCKQELSKFSVYSNPVIKNLFNPSQLWSKLSLLNNQYVWMSPIYKISLLCGYHFAVLHFSRSKKVLHA